MPAADQASRTAAKLEIEAGGVRSVATIRLIVLIAAALFLCVLGVNAVAHVAEPSARALFLGVLALPVGALVLLIQRSWASLTQAHAARTVLANRRSS